MASDGIVVWARSDRVAKSQETTNQEDVMKADIAKTIADVELEETRAKLQKVEEEVVQLRKAAGAPAASGPQALGHQLFEMGELLKRDNLPPATRERVQKAHDGLEREYIHAMSPHHAARYEQALVEKAQSADDPVMAEVTRKAEEIRKSDPTLSLAQAQLRAFEGDPALQARYIESFRQAA
jgi:hypothetical protein